MTRFLPSILAAFALTGCGASYYEGSGASYQQAQYSQSATAQATVQTQAQPQEVAIGGTLQDDWYEDTDPTALTEFHTTLDPYGSWVDDEVYGTVWVPSATVVGADFAPYVSAGHWVYANDYVWVSDYDWGWAPFHYGRWTYITNRGWGWIPGRRYAGAWVTWRTGYDGWGYVGWAPLPPTWYWRSGVAFGLGWYPRPAYVFCAHEHVFAPQVGGRIVTGARVQEVGTHTRGYVPAQPGVDASGRTVAAPTVNGLSVGGPPPGQLGIQGAPGVPQGHAGLMRAEQYSKPSSATQVGARPPMINNRAPDALGRTQPNASLQPTIPTHNNPLTPNANPPVYRPQGSTVVGTQMPSQVPQYQPQYRPPSVQPMPQYQPQYQPQYRPPSAYQPYSGPSVSGPSVSPQYQPQFRAPTVSPQPQYQPQYRAPTVSPQYQGGGGGFSAPRMSSPSVGGGGGFSAPRMSSPSVGGGGGGFSAPRMSSPSMGGGGGGGARPMIRR